MGHGKVYSLEDKLMWGKYKGESVEDIIDHDVNYISYLMEEQGIELDNEAYEYYSRRSSEGS